MVAQAQHEHGVDVDHERFTGPERTPRGRRAGASGKAGPVARGDLVAAGERPLPFAPGPAHGQAGQAGDLGFRHPFPAAIPEGVEHRRVPDVDDARGFAEAGDRARVLDERQPVDEVVGVRQHRRGEGVAEALELVVGQVALGEIVRHPALDPDAPPLPFEQVLDEVGDELDLVLAAHRGEAEDPVLGEPGLVGD
ncbi:MAG: hypothetical protein H6P95_160, partial [Candidatus Aminicenantes bacterium]|nr:hypothetical protein [Candidatus Aminicenantes bacterium]